MPALHMPKSETCNGKRERSDETYAKIMETLESPVISKKHDRTKTRAVRGGERGAMKRQAFWQQHALLDCASEKSPRKFNTCDGQTDKEFLTVAHACVHWFLDAWPHAGFDSRGLGRPFGFAPTPSTEVARIEEKLPQQVTTFRHSKAVLHSQCRPVTDGH